MSDHQGQDSTGSGAAFAAAFYARPVVYAANGCRLWRGARSSKGYGNFQFGGRTYGAHRIAYFLKHGRSPTGGIVRHTCDNPDCVNPDHLRIGSNADNSDDSVAAGRANRKPMEEVLTELNARDVKIMRGEGQAIIDVARTLRISPTSVRRIDRGEIFAHVEGPKPKEMRGNGGKVRYTTGPGHSKSAPRIIDANPKPAPRAERNTAPLTQADVWDIKTLMADGWSDADIYRELGRSPTTIRHIRNGTAWKWVSLYSPRGQSTAPSQPSSQCASPQVVAMLTDDDVRHIRKLKANGASVGSIASTTGFAFYRVREITRGNTYRWVAMP